VGTSISRVKQTVEKREEFRELFFVKARGVVKGGLE
jgi:hypothetical protein